MKIQKISIAGVFRKIRLSNKLLVFFISLGLIPTFAVSTYIYSTSQKAILKRTFDQLTSVRRLKSKELEIFIDDRFREIRLLSESDDIQNLRRKLDSLLDKGEINDTILKSADALFDSYTRRHLNTAGYYKKFIISDNQNNQLIFNLSENEPTEFHKKSDHVQFVGLGDSLKDKSTLITDISSVNEEDEPSLIVASKLRNGFVAIEIALSAINYIMLETDPRNGLGESGEAYLVGNDNLMRSTSRFWKNSVLKTEVSTKSVTNALQGKVGYDILTDYRGIDVLSSYGKVNIEGLDWVILAEINQDEAMIPIVRIRNDIIFIFFLVVILVTGLSFVMAGSIVNPIAKLEKAALEVGKGEFDNKVEVNTSDEIGILAESFNTMTSRLKIQTAELMEREQRLRHFYNATADGIILHKNGKPVLVNNALISLTGYSEKELMDRSLSDIVVCSTIDNNGTYETLAKTKNGEMFPVEIQERKVMYNRDTISACVIRDITKRKAVEDELKLERERRLSAIFDGQEMERQRLSRELHDGLGQTLIASKLMLENTNKSSDEITEDMKGNLNQVIQEVRYISYDLMPHVLSEFGLATALRQLSNNLSQDNSITVRFDQVGEYNLRNDKITIYLYRIAQEAINNAIRHSGATEITVELINQNDFVILMIEDNGHGFNFEQTTSTTVGNGLFNMKERVNLLGGILDISSSSEGTVVTVKLNTV